MIIFISHSSKDDNYGNALVELLREVGVRAKEIIFTSNPAYGIPISSNIFDWLKSTITDKPFVIYLLSEKYYESVACLNEMGAAWIVENKGYTLFVPGFNLDNHKFRSGVLDPRSIGFFLDDEDRVTEFIESLRDRFSIVERTVLINQAIKKYLDKLETLKISSRNKDKENSVPLELSAKSIEAESLASEPKPLQNRVPEQMTKYLTDLKEGRLKDSDVMLICYVYEQGRIQLMTGWQESQEIDRIRNWEEVHAYPKVLSVEYGNALRRLEMRKLVTVSQLTSSNNPKEMKVIDPLANFLSVEYDKIESHVEAVAGKLKAGMRAPDLPF
jgi:hypothetical protein